MVSWIFNQWHVLNDVNLNLGYVFLRLRTLLPVNALSRNMNVGFC